MKTAGIEDVQARFDRVAAEWDSNPGRVALARGIAGAIRTAVPVSGDMKVLDFGAGTGLLTLGLLPHVGSIMAVDASGEMLRVLAGKLTALGIGNVHTLHCDIGKEPLPQAEYSLVVSSMVLHHIQDVAATLVQLRRSLRPGGWIALADLDAEDGSFHPDPTGVFHKGFDRGQIRDWLEAAGFVWVSAREVYRMVKPAANGVVRDYPVFLVTGKVST